MKAKYPSSNLNLNKEQIDCKYSLPNQSLTKVSDIVILGLLNITLFFNLKRSLSIYILF